MCIYFTRFLHFSSALSPLATLCMLFRFSLLLLLFCNIKFPFLFSHYFWHANDFRVDMYRVQTHTHTQQATFIRVGNRVFHFVFQISVCAKYCCDCLCFKCTLCAYKNGVRSMLGVCECVCNVHLLRCSTERQREIATHDLMTSKEKCL